MGDMITRYLNHKTAIILTIIIVLIAALFAGLGSSFAMSNEDTVPESEKQVLLSEVHRLGNTGATTYSSGAATGEERSLILKDFNENGAYIYMEFNTGGYAIYDREGVFIYERATEGDGPYKNYDAKDELYYGGPQGYYVKVNDKFVNTVINEEISIVEGKSWTAAVDEKRESAAAEAAESRSTYAIGEVTLKALGCDRGSDFAGQLYFSLFSIVSPWKYGKYPNYYSNPSENSDIDVLFANNIFGSCSVVAMAMVMQYYDRMAIAYKDAVYPNNGYKRMLPDDVSRFRDRYLDKTQKDTSKDSKKSLLRYNYENNKKINYDNKNAYRGEYLHQELLNRMFKDFHTNKTSYGINLSTMIKYMPAYFSNYGLENISLSHRLFDTGVSEQIKKGNPILLSFRGNPAPNDKEDGNLNRSMDHSVVVYAFYQKEGIFGIKTVQEYVANFGWLPNKKYGEIILNKHLAYANMNFNVF